MAIVFLLGPGEWLEPRPGPSPMEHRRELAKILLNHDHAVILMEDEPDDAGEDMVAKFDRLLARATDVVLYWPLKAKMSTTYTEMVLLRKAQEAGVAPRLWFLHHEEAAAIERGAFRVLEGGNRSRYLTSLARLGVRPVPWGSLDELRERVALLAAELG